MKLYIRENCIIVLPVNILTGLARWLVGPHNTLLCVLIHYTVQHPVENSIIGVKMSTRISAGVDDCPCFCTFTNMIHIDYKITNFP